jgi:CoA:oxalate CoA-transferase
LGLEHLKDRPEFANNGLRFEHRTAINGEINARTRLQSVDHWIEVINRAGVPCGRVLNVAEVFADPQTQHQQMRITIDHPQHGALDVLGFPIKFTQAPCSMHRPPPVLGGDTDEILRELGLAPDQIHHLRQAKVI